MIARRRYHGTPAIACRGGPISAGWNSAAETSVQASDKPSNLPMLEIPGLLENMRLPKAVAVISALKNTARVQNFRAHQAGWRHPFAHQIGRQIGADHGLRMQ